MSIVALENIIGGHAKFSLNSHFQNSEIDIGEKQEPVFCV